MKMLLLLFAFIGLKGDIQSPAPLKDPWLSARQNILLKKQRTAIGCGIDRAAFDPAINTIPLLPGWGKYRMPVTAKNDSCYIYFEQGINLYYGFHIIEALASFTKSTGFDSTFAMGYWGIALAYGPNINDIGYDESPNARGAAQKAKALSANASPPEKALIDAIVSRYMSDPTRNREQLNHTYADAMRIAHKNNPESQDIAALYADAMMQQHPWDLYDHFGKPKSWTPLIVQTLEDVLKVNPEHPGAAHYYIHAVEASDHPERGLAAAKLLPVLTPGIAHLVHMPAHIYIRTGDYKEGWMVDTHADRAYKDYLERYPPTAGNAFLYLSHNLHLKAACANMEGRYADAMQASIDTRNSFDSNQLSTPDFLGIYMQFMYMTPQLTQLRFGKWDAILHDTPVSHDYVYADILTHFCRGVAFARTGLPDDAYRELQSLRHDTNNKQLLAPAPNYSNPGIIGSRLTEKILSGVIEESRQHIRQAIALYGEAIQIEDSMNYNEPRDWQQPARQYLGNALLRSGQYQAAERIFREDLRVNARNGWSYTGLAAALAGQGKQMEANTVRALARQAFTRSDTKITSAVL